MNENDMAIALAEDVLKSGLGISQESYGRVFVEGDRVVFAEAQETTPESQRDFRFPGTWPDGTEVLDALTAVYRLETDPRWTADAFIAASLRARDALRRVRAESDRIMGT